MEHLKVSNYDKMRDSMESVFLKYDQTQMIEKFHLIHDTEYLYIDFVGRTYRVDRKSGRVTYAAEGTDSYQHADYNISMTIFDVLCESKPDCQLSNTYVPVNRLKNVVQTTRLGADFCQKEARCFKNKCSKLSRACEHLGGIAQKVGDVSYQIPLFPFLPVVLQFWDADEEFDAVLKLMWDEHILDYMHYETTYFAAAHLLERVVEEIKREQEGKSI